MARKYFKKTEESHTLDAADEASVETAEEASTEISETPAPKPPLVKRAAYKTLYAVSYGAVFSSLLLRKLLVPKNSFVESALHDGAVAAQHAFEEKEHLVEEVVKETEEFFSGGEESPAAAA